MGYTKSQLIDRLEDKSCDMNTFYKNDFVNYRGRTDDTGEYYTEVIAEWLLANLGKLDEIRQITRESSYLVAGHDGVVNNDSSNREEELIAMAMRRQADLGILGRVVDYQTPLKNKKNDEAGKIDLLAYDGEFLSILELKKPGSKETMLRCVLEGYTYLKTVDSAKLIADFAPAGVAPGVLVRACPFVFSGGSQWAEMQKDRPFLRRLMRKLDSKPFYIVDTDGRYDVREE